MKTRRLTKFALLRIADKAYENDGIILRAAAGKEVGDDLARFIANELVETFDSGATRQDQLEASWAVMNRARRQMNRVMMAFFDQQVADNQADRAYLMLGRAVIKGDR